MGHTGEPGAEATLFTPIHQGLAELGESIDRVVAERNTLRTQKATMHKVLVAIVGRSEAGEVIQPDAHEIKAARAAIADLQSREE